MMFLLNLEPVAYVRIFVNFLTSSFFVFVPGFGISYLLFRNKEKTKKIFLLSLAFSLIIGLIFTGFIVYKLSLLYQDLNTKVSAP